MWTQDHMLKQLKECDDKIVLAESSNRDYSHHVRALEWQKFQADQLRSGLEHLLGDLRASFTGAQQDKGRLEGRLHGALIRVSSLEGLLSKSKSDHWAELASLTTDLQSSNQVRLHVALVFWCTVKKLDVAAQYELLCLLIANIHSCVACLSIIVTTATKAC